MSCSISRIVRSRLSSRSSAIMRTDSSGPMPAIGSSSSSMRGRGRERHRDLELAVLAVAHARRRCTSSRPASPTRASVSRAGSRNAASLRASRQKWNEWPACACTASATLSSAVKSLNSEVIWNERASPRWLRWWTGSAVMSCAGEADAAGVGRDLAGQLADQRGLAGAVRTDDGVQLARRHREVDAVGRDDAAEALGQTVDREQRVSHGAGSPASR